MGCDNNAADDMLFLKVVSIDALDYMSWIGPNYVIVFFFLENVVG
jgi:hypothetical protein